LGAEGEIELFAAIVVRPAGGGVIPGRGAPVDEQIAGADEFMELFFKFILEVGGEPVREKRVGEKDPKPFVLL